MNETSPAAGSASGPGTGPESQRVTPSSRQHGVGGGAEVGPETGQAAGPAVAADSAPRTDAAPGVAVASSFGRSGLPVLPPLMAVIEILVLIVLPGALDYFWTGFPSLAETQPHFFWLPVLLLSLQYGTVSGLVAAGVAIVVSALLGWPDQEVGENHFSYLLRIWAQPVLWLTAALVLGQFRMRQIEQKQDLARHVAELSTQRTAISDYATNLRSRCETLERQIAGRREPEVRTILAALARLNAGGTQAPSALGECLELALGPCAASIYVRDNDRFRLTVAHGSAANRQEQLADDAPLARAIAREGRAVSVLNPGEEAIFAGDGLAAVPVFSVKDGRIFGLLKLDAVGAAEFDEMTPACLAAIAGQVAPLLESGGIAGLSGIVPAVQVVAPPSRQRLWRQLKWQRPAARAPRAQAKTLAGE